MYGLCELILAASIVQADQGGLTLKGTVDDAQGQVVAGARVDIATAAPRVGRGLFCPSCYRDCKKSTRSDQRGQFEITGLDPSLKFRVLVSKPGKKAQLTALVDPLEEGLKVSLADLPRDLPAETTLRGQVVDDQGAPIEGALIDPSGGKSGDRRWWGEVKGVDPTVSDAEGRFIMPLPKDYQAVDLQIAADGFAGAWASLVAPGASEHRIVVPLGTRVTGRLEYQGKPLPAVRVSVVQVERAAGRNFIKAVGDVTDADGAFVFENLPADEHYVIFSVVGEGPQEFVLTTKRFKAAGNGHQRDLGTLAAMPALRLAGRVEIAGGQKLPSDAKIMLHRDPAWDLIATPIDPQGRFSIGGLPDEAYEIRIAAKGFRLDPAGIRYQVVSDQSFGLRLDESIDDLLIPLVAGK